MLIPRYLTIKKTLLILLGIVLLAAAVRFYSPTFRSLWGDEVHSLYNAYDLDAHNYHFERLSPADEARSLANISFGSLVKKDSHLPLYFLLLSIWINIFGISEFALRSLSIIFGILSVPLIYVLAKEMFDEKVALLSAFLLSISSFAILYSQEIRMYSVLLFLSLLSSLYFFRLLSGKISANNMVGYLISTILFALTHVYASIGIAAQFLILVFKSLKDKTFKSSLPIFGLQLLSGSLVSFFYFTVLMNSASILTSDKADMAFAAFPSYLKAPLYFFVLTLGETVAPWNWRLVIPAGFVFGYLFLRTLKRVSDAGTLYLQFTCIFAIVFCALLLRPTMPKYLILVLPFYLILIARALSELSSTYLKYFLIGVICLTQIFSLYNYFNLKEYHNSNQIEPWRKVGSAISEQYKTGDLIVATNRYIAYRALEYYLNALKNAEYPVYSLQKDVFSGVDARQKQIMIYGAEGSQRRFPDLRAKRIWLVTEIHDDQILPPGYVSKVRQKIAKTFTLSREERYVPYEMTLAAKLPKKRHALSSARIEMYLYVRR